MALNILKPNRTQSQVMPSRCLLLDLLTHSPILNCVLRKIIPCGLNFHQVLTSVVAKNYFVPPMFSLHQRTEAVEVARVLKALRELINTDYADLTGWEESKARWLAGRHI